MRRKFFCSALQ